MAKKWFCVFFSVILLFNMLVTPSLAYVPSSFSVSAEGCILSSADTNMVLYEKNADEKLFPASLTKIMTATVILDECEDPANTTVTASKSAIDILLGTDSSTFGLMEGEQLSVLNLLYILLVHSANDAANILAEHFGGGNIAGFIDKMNAKAESLKMTGTHYVNAHGLHDQNHYTTPRDMLTLTRYAMKNEIFKKIIGTVRYTVPATNMHKARILATTVFLQDPNTPVQSHFYKYTDGGKTGYTDEAGRCLVSVATKKGASYICVLMKCPVTDAKGNKVRMEFTDSRNLYEWAFNDFEYRQVFDTATPVGECPVALSSDSDHVALVLKREVNAVLPKTADNSTVQVKLDLYSNPVKAPIQTGQVLGKATIVYAGETIDTVEVVAMNAVKRSALLAFAQTLKDIISSRAARLVALAVVGILVLLLVYCVWLNRRKKRRRRRKHY